MESWDAIVIGAEISGMCAASLLAGAGKRVLVLEKQDQIGGRATTLSVKIAGEEYRMDNGSFHAITIDRPRPPELPLLSTRKTIASRKRRRKWPRG